ncbi:hypothetical protein ZIOFF_017927 [Zingiber officinale]|uniref:Uncharacterized protein n=1 Tax=Zingiber officinale TaxID=94328 RepID=A0A8J5H5E0_ZINOF|nr:hypothetical protein ZIOFF_017927 [Zingiber officinale]
MKLLQFKVHYHLKRASMLYYMHASYWHKATMELFWLGGWTSTLSISLCWCLDGYQRIAIEHQQYQSWSCFKRIVT